MKNCLFSPGWGERNQFSLHWTHFIYMSTEKNYLHCCLPACLVASVISDSLWPYGLAPLCMRFSRVDMPSSRGSSRPRDWTCVSYVSCFGRWVLYHQCHLRSPFSLLPSIGLQSFEGRSSDSWTEAFVVDDDNDGEIDLEKGATGWDVWIASLTQWSWIWANSQR